MIRILLMSDSHGFEDNVRWALEKYGEHVDRIIHLGDGIMEQTLLRATGKSVVSVAGNCDWWSDEPAKRVFALEGVRMLLTHGHEFNVKRRLDTLAYAAEAAGAQIALYGHTHQQKDVEMGGVRLINPGALQSGRCAVMTISDGKVDVEMVNLND